MGIDFGYLSLVRVKIVLLMAGATFALVLCAQLFEHRDFKSLSSLYAAGKIEVGQDSFIYHNSSRNSTYPSVLDAANANVADLVSTDTEVSDEIVSGVSNVKGDSDPENVEKFGDTWDDDLDPED